MRYWMVLGLVVMVSVPLHAQNQARNVIEKAISAHGGEKHLTTLKAGFLKVKGNVFFQGGVTFSQQMYYQLPNQIKLTEEFASRDKKTVVVTVFNGDKGWMTVDDKLSTGMNPDLDKKILTELQETAHLLLVTRLVALKNMPFQLVYLGETTVNSRPSLAIKVAAEGHRDL